MRASPVVLLLALLAGTALAVPARSETGKPVRLTITSVKAAPASDAHPAGMGPGLERVATKLQRLPFARFDADTTKSQELASGDGETSVEMPFGAGGRFVVKAKPSDDGSVHVAITEFGPGADKPCLSSETRVESGRTHVTFCDGVPARDSTLIFLLSVQ